MLSGDRCRLRPLVVIGSMAAFWAVLLIRSVDAEVVINEVLASNQFTNVDEDGDSSDWVELFNNGATAADLAGYTISDDPAGLRSWVFPTFPVAPGGYALVWCSGKDREGIPAERIEERNSTLPFVADLIAEDDPWRYLSGAPEAAGPPAAWRAPDFDDSAWEEGLPALGFGSDDGLRTMIPEGSSALFLRRSFEYRPGAGSLVLSMRYDDGFVAYLNGVRVAAANFPEDEEPTFASVSERSHSPRTLERVDLSSVADLLVDGRNVLAVVALNIRPTSRDLVFTAELGRIPPILHTSFQLRSGGETVLLANPDGDVVDEVTLPPQTYDQSYGRSPDGSGRFLYHLTPSPRAPNAGATGETALVVGDTTFSVDRGFFDEPISVEISTETGDARIRYTLDGSAPTVESGTLYEGPVAIDRTATLRAIAFEPGKRSSNVDTQTYIFLDEVVRQDFQATLASGFPRTWGSTAADYGMDPDVIGPNDRFGGIYAETIRDDLLSLPSMSIVMDLADLLGPQGIYTRSDASGPQWERAASVELISPDFPGEESREFQVNCGIRIQGGWFRSHAGTRKHSLRLLFRRQYGPAKLEFPLFGEDTFDRFDTVTLRAGANDGYSWRDARLTEQYTRDEFGRSLQRATGNAGAPGTFVHLYLNGIYWGLYNPVVRPDHSFSSMNYGGDKEEWDAVHDLQTTNGDTRAWNEMVSQTAAARTSVEEFMALQGMNPDGTRNPDLPHLLDVPNYVDYLLVNVWGGNWDWPWKNWWAGRYRGADSTGFKFYCWDFENTMGNNRGRSPLTKNALQNNFSSAGLAHTNLRGNPEYRQVFGDRAQRLFRAGGLLSPESLVARYDALTARVESAIVAESARWGDQHHGVPLTQREWTNERNWLLGSYLRQRSAIVLTQLRAARLYSPVDSPIFDRAGGVVPAGFRALPYAADGEVWYTTDGSDPRLPGGALSEFAQQASPGETVTLVPAQAPVRVLVPTDDSLALDWTGLDFDDGDWREGMTAVGYETGEGYEDLISLDVADILYDVNPGIYLRIPFEVDDPSVLALARLKMRFDDGFVAYINGQRVASSRARENLAWDSRSSSSHSDRLAQEWEVFSLGDGIAHIHPGRNVLAIHAMNVRVGDSDFLVQPELVAADPAEGGIVIDRSRRIRTRTRVEDEWSAIDEETFIVDTNIPLRITEIHYHPASPPDGEGRDADEYEFIELRNIGAGGLNLAEIRLRGGVEFEFARSSQLTLGPGESLLVVENVDAFRERYGERDWPIAGEYRGKLANDGEVLVLEGHLGEPILEFSYDDAWIPETDGAGSSLVLVDPSLPRESWGDPASWRASAVSGGTPAGDGPGASGRQLAGDANQDARLNITDAVLLLRFLFSNDPSPLPCDGATVADGGNVTLLDVDLGGSVDLTDAVLVLNYLFQGGVPPAHGSECVLIPGCPDVCTN